jgi:hypothetical protein
MIMNISEKTGYFMGDRPCIGKALVNRSKGHAASPVENDAGVPGSIHHEGAEFKVNHQEAS